MLYCIYKPKKLCKEQKFAESMIPFWSKSYKTPKLTIKIGDWSLHLPWIYIMPVLSNLRVLSYKRGIGTLVYLHSKWYFMSTATFSKSNPLATRYLKIYASLKKKSFPDLTSPAPSTTYLFYVLGPKVLMLSRSMLCISLNLFFTSCIWFFS
jgi:hypothetical protein